MRGKSLLLAWARPAAAALSALLGGPASAQEAPPAPVTPPPPTAAAAEAAGPAEAEDAFRWRRVELGGRVLARGFTERAGGTSRSDAEAENARVELRWRPARWLRGAFEYDAVDDRHLKDAYLAFRGGGFEARAGQFKPPFSPVQMSSRWDLPTADRGLLSELLVYSFGIAGRRPGLQVEWSQPKGALVAMAGVFRASSVRGDRIGDEAFDNLARGGAAWKATARLAYARKRLEAGTSFDLRPAEPVPGEGYRRLWTSGVDLTWAARRAGPRVWAEGCAGSSWQDANAFDGDDALFLGGRVIAGWRFGGGKEARVTLEPFVGGTLFDPDASVRDDLLWEAAGGVHLSGFSHFRLTLEAQRRTVSRNAPLSLGLFTPGARAEGGRTRLVAQLGAAF